jgi:type III pantothenate kinase
VIDIGNSGIKIALADCRSETVPKSHQVFQHHQFDWNSSRVSRVWQATWKHADLRSLAETDSREAGRHQPEVYLDLNDTGWPQSVLAQLQDHFSVSMASQRQGWVLSSVHRQASTAWIQAVSQIHPQDICRLMDYRDLQWELKVDAPQRVGTDRVVAAWSAWQLLQRRSPCVVIQAGTAITVDAVDSSGAFAGGAIMPGLRLTLNALAGGTDLLPHLTTPASPSELPRLPGKNTEDAMLAGGVAAVIGGIDLLLKRYRDLYGNELPILISGGNRAYLAPLLSYRVQVVDHLVLLGLSGLLDSWTRSDSLKGNGI